MRVEWIDYRPRDGAPHTTRTRTPPFRTPKNNLRLYDMKLYYLRSDVSSDVECGRVPGGCDGREGVGERADN